MKLKYITRPPSEGGGAISGCGTIHCSEVHATLTKLSDDLEFPFDLNDYVLGSTGKTEYSGDIDIVIDNLWYDAGYKAFHIDLVKQFGLENTSRNGAMVHLKYPIVNFDSTLDESKPRTGFVQIDFNFGDPVWERFYHFSPGRDSEYKGAHRNLAIAAITSSVNIQNSEVIDEEGNPVSVIRWKWGQNGLIQVNRHKKMIDDVWTRKVFDEVVAGPVTDPENIAQILFPVDGSIHDLFSLESIIQAVKRNYKLKDRKLIFAKMASNFSDWNDGKYFEYPPEINRYFTYNDK